MKVNLCLFLVFLGFISTAQNKYDLSDFFGYNPSIEQKIDSIMLGLNDEEIAGQVIVAAAGRLGKSDAHIEKLVTQKKVGGILLLNGEREEFKKRVDRLDSITSSVGGIKLTYSADAEPSLIRYKIKGCSPVVKAADHKSEAQVVETAKSICKDLDYIGITHNYAPVIDVSTSNAAIGDRSFGDNIEAIIQWSNTFISTSQNLNIAATAKHFPGHGQVVGDTHKKLVYIDGEMNEVKNYQAIIDSGVVSIMVAHIAVKNNPAYNSDLPATLNKKIVTDLLKEEMGFRGLVITDAMGMGGVKSIPNNGILALKAGVDVLLMPVDEFDQVNRIVAEMQKDEAFRRQVQLAARKVLRLKICQGLIK